VEAGQHAVVFVTQLEGLLDVDLALDELQGNAGLLARVHGKHKLLVAIAPAHLRYLRVSARIAATGQGVFRTEQGRVESKDGVGKRGVVGLLRNIRIAQMRCGHGGNPCSLPTLLAAVARENVSR